MEILPNKLIKYCVIIVTLSLSSFHSFAQIDTLHYIPPFYYTGNNNGDFNDHYAVLSTFESIPFTVTVKNNDGTFHQEVTISQNSPAIIDLGNRFNAEGMINSSQTNTVLDTEGLIITGSKGFFVNITHLTNIQGMIVTSKGTVGLGKDFYSGHMYTVLEGNNDNNNRNKRRAQFISFMASENNTFVTVSNPNFTFDGHGSNTFTVVLHAGQSYLVKRDLFASGLTNVTVNNINGTHITSNKPIVVNSGSWTAGMDAGLRDIGVDQLVPVDITGKQYILCRGGGSNLTESIIVVATEDNTAIYLNGNSSAFTNLSNAGDYAIIPESQYSNSTDNLFIESDKDVYVFQSMAGSTSNATTGMYFIPRLTCNASKKVQISYADFLGNPEIKLVTQVGSTVTINGNTISGAQSVPGNPNWVSYSIPQSDLTNYDPGPNWNFLIESTGALNAALTIESNAIGAGGYYSGFGTVPEITYNAVLESSGMCAENVEFTASGYSDYIWFKDGEEIPGESNSTYVCESPGRYKVVGITSCAGQPSLTYPSEEIRILPCLSVSPASYAVTEGNTSEPNITLTVKLSHSWLEDDVSFDYATVGSTAVAGKDFTNVSGSGTIAKGDTSFTISIPILNDELAEDDETFELIISSPVNAVLSTATGTCTIHDDNDPKPFISVPATSFFPEDTGIVQLEVSLDRESGQTITADYEIVPLTATSGDDYNAGSYSGTITFLPEELTKNITFSIVDDITDEPGLDEQFELKIKNIVNAQSGNLTNTIGIADNDSTPVISVSSSGSTEGSDLKITGSLSNPSDEVLSFDYFTIDVVAIAPDDYTAITTKNMSVAAGETRFEINVTTVDDIIMEGTEVFEINFENLQFAKFSNDSARLVHQAKIIDNDGKPQVTIKNVSVIEGGDFTFEIAVSHPASSAVRLKYATADNTALAPGDYTAVTPKTIVIPPNNLSKTFTVSTIEDTEEEGNETFFINLTDLTDNAEFEDSIAIGTITDNDEMPVAKNDNYTLNEDNVISDNVMTNDEGLGDIPVAITSHTDPAHGSITLNNSTGEFTYEPVADFFGKDTIFYTITDVDNDESTARVTFTVLSVNDVPVAISDDFTTTENTIVSGDVLLNDTGLGDGVNVSIKTTVSNGTMNMLSNGTFTYTPTAQFFGTDQFTYEITDGNGDVASATVRIQVGFTNDYNPVTVNDTISTQEEVPVNIDLAANDTDNDGYSTLDLESIFIKTGPANATLTIVGGGVVTYTPDAGFFGNDSFTYTIRDEDGQESNEGTVFVTVTVNNDPPVAACVDSTNVFLDKDGVAILMVNDIDDGSYDPDGDAITKTLSKSNFTVTDLGTTTVSLIVEDSYNAQSSCQTEVHVLDTISPVITNNPNDTVLYATSDKCGMTVYYNLPVFDDNCDGQSNGTLISGYSPGSVFTDTTSIVYEISDASGNGPVQVAFEVIVLDTISPQISYSGATSFLSGGSNEYIVTDNSLDVIASDNCSLLNLSHDFSGGGTSLNGFSIPVGEHIINWTATDVSGNTTSFTYTIEVEAPINVELASLDADTTVCQGEEMVFEATSTGGSGAISYDFQVDGVSLQSGSSHLFAISSLTDAQEVKVVVTDESLNSSESNGISVTITETPAIDLIYRQPNN